MSDTAELKSLAGEAQKLFGALSPDQLNWRSDAKSWSIGQCFEHLIKSNELYFRDFEAIAGSSRQTSFWEKWSPLSGFFGKFIADSLKKDSQKVKTIPQAVPSSAIDAEIIERFIAHQNILIEKIAAMNNADWRKTKLTSPFLKIATYNLSDTIKIIIEHEKRHFRQAERVLELQNSKGKIN